MEQITTDWPVPDDITVRLAVAFDGLGRAIDAALAEWRAAFDKIADGVANIAQAAVPYIQAAQAVEDAHQNTETFFHWQNGEDYWTYRARFE